MLIKAKEQWSPETISKTGRVRKAIRLGETIF
jgi:hypothetical protein